MNYRIDDDPPSGQTRNHMGERMDQFLAIYNEISAEFTSDLKRRLEIKLGSVADPFSAAALTNEFWAHELAQLRAQLLDLDLRLSQVANHSRKAALLSPATTIAMPKVYGANGSISMADSIATYGFYMPEELANGMFRWSGPTTNCGLIAYIDRNKPISVKIPILSSITPDITVVGVRIDGEPVKFTFPDPKSLRFQIPALSSGDDLLFTPTLFSLTLNNVVRPSDTDPDSQDNRALGIAIYNIMLTSAPPDNR